MRRRRLPEPAGPAACRSCGACCEAYGDALAAEAPDLARWAREGRADLLARVGEGGALWVDPATGEYQDRCPFLVADGPERRLCAIHATKPDMCRAYPTPDHGLGCLGDDDG